MTPEEIVQQQVEAYNRHDLDAFSATYADDIMVYRFPSMELVLQGRAALERFYREQRFNLSELKAEIVSRISHGNKIIDEERVSGLAEGEAVRAVAIYEVLDGLIHRVWFVEE